jgi:hypothetical protein
VTYNKLIFVYIRKGLIQVTRDGGGSIIFDEGMQMISTQKHSYIEII